MIESVWVFNAAQSVLRSTDFLGFVFEKFVLRVASSLADPNFCKLGEFGLLLSKLMSAKPDGVEDLLYYLIADPALDSYLPLADSG